MLGPFATTSRRTPHCHSPGVATVTRCHCRRCLCIDVHNNDDDNNDNAWQRGPLWPHRMGPINWAQYKEIWLYSMCCSALEKQREFPVWTCNQQQYHVSESVSWWCDTGRRWWTTCSPTSRRCWREWDRMWTNTRWRRWTRGLTETFNPPSTTRPMTRFTVCRLINQRRNIAVFVWTCH